MVMTMGLQIQRVSRVRVLSTLIAIFALVAQPLYGTMSTQVASALEPGVAVVANETDLQVAAADVNIKVISIKASFTISQKIVFSDRSVYIDGNDNKITFAADQKGWNGNYVFQAYKNILTLKNLRIAGGDAAVFANGAILNLQGVVEVSGNEFGGIEVSQGDGVMTPAVLNATNTTLINSSEKAAKPTVWVDKASTVNATVNGTFTRTTHVGVDQEQFYLDSANANITATNHTSGRTYGDIQSAVDAANTNDTIVLSRNDISLSKSIQVNKKIVIDGFGFTVKTPFQRGTNGVANAAFIITADGATLKNTAIHGAGGVGAAHGVVVYGVDDVTLSGLTVRNNAAGIIVNNSKVLVRDITSINNAWYAVNVDKVSELTIAGSNNHTEPIAIYVDDRTQNKVIDNDKKYELTTDPNPAKPLGDIYNIDKSIPTANFKYSNNNGNAVTKDDVTVTMTTNESVVKPVGWTQITTKIFTKVHDSNGTFSVILEDFAGNKNTVTYEVKRIDRIAPVIKDVEAGKVYKDSVLYTITEQNIGKIVISLDGVEKTYSQNTAPRSLSDDGSYILTVIDKAGNRASISFSIDKIKPVITTSDDANTIVSGVKTFSITQIEKNPSKLYVEFMRLQWVEAKNKMEWIKVSGKEFKDVNFGELTIDTLQMSDDDKYQIKVSSTDKAGNKGGYSFAFTIKNTLDPGDLPVSENNDNKIGGGNSQVRELNLIASGRTITSLSEPAMSQNVGSDIATQMQNNTVIGDTPAILGTQDSKTNVASVAPVEATEGGWKVFGVSWYWLLAVVAAGGGAWWLLAAYRRQA